MSVLIKGMKMPSFCGTCVFHKGAAGIADFCSLTNRRRFRFKNRPKDCPLFEVQPHGRLIDAEAVERDAQKRLLLCNKNDEQFQKPYEVMRAIALAPTIIPAEEGE